MTIVHCRAVVQLFLYAVEATRQARTWRAIGVPRPTTRPASSIVYDAPAFFSTGKNQALHTTAEPTPYEEQLQVCRRIYSRDMECWGKNCDPLLGRNERLRVSPPEPCCHRASTKMTFSDSPDFLA